MIQEILGSQLGLSICIICVGLGVILTADAYCIYFERKVSAWMQDRYGPNRVGPLGLLQPLADGIKFILKEEFIPARADKILFYISPAIGVIIALVGFVILPVGGRVHWSWMPEGATLLAQGASIDIGVLYLLAVGSLTVYGVVLGGWASNNKYAFYGAMRSAAQMLSYEVPLGLALMTLILTFGELRLEGIVDSQIGAAWNAFLHPVAFLIMLTTALAETNRAPFDLAEAEQELIGGYHTEYSSMKFAQFFLAEYTHMITASGLLTALFLGGYEPVPFSRLLSGVSGLSWLYWISTSVSPWAMVLRMMVFCGKISFFIFVMMWLRWTLVRFRFDQLMRLSWKALVPIGMAIVIFEGVLLYLGRPVSWFSTLAEIGILLVAAVISLLSGKPITGRQLSLVEDDALTIRPSRSRAMV